MQYVPDNYDMFLQYEAEQERRRRREAEELEELHGSGKDCFMENGDRDFD